MFENLKEKLAPLFGVKLAVGTIKEFFTEKSFFHGAALAYYAIFAMVPILYLAVNYIGGLLGNEVMTEIITTAIQQNLGINDVNGILSFLESIDFEESNRLLNIVGLFALIFSSTAILNSLRNSINDFYNVKPAYSNRKKQVIRTVLSKLISVLLLTGISAVVIVFYFAETVFLGLSANWFSEFETFNWILSSGFRHVASIAMNVLIFSFMFKFLHDGRVLWKVAIRGAILTSVLLFIGQILIKIYITNYFFVSEGGVAGSILVILVWMYYTSQIIFLGAKFTKVYADLIGHPIVNREY